MSSLQAYRIPQTFLIEARARPKPRRSADYRSVLATMLLAIVMTGCAAASRETFQDNYRAGFDAERAGDYRAARKGYAAALDDAARANLGPASISAASYELGRVTGYLCDHEEAERLLKKSLALELKISGAHSKFASARIFELARLYFDRGQYAKSLPLYERGIPLLERLEVDKSDPHAYLDAMEEYGNALRESGHENGAKQIKTKVDRLRAKHAQTPRGFVPTRYNRKCAGKSS